MFGKGSAAMAAQLPTSLHLLARQIEGQWVVECLDFSLAAQDDTFESAQRRIVDQASSYVETALSIDGGVHADQLLSRRAPLWDWIVFHFLFLTGKLIHNVNQLATIPKSYVQPFQFQGA
jgi:hypothetical protein